MTDMTLRPSATNPGRTYKWFQDTPVFDFGFGLHFTKFAASWQDTPQTQYKISDLVRNAKGSHIDLSPFDTFHASIKNTGKVASDYVALLFVSSNAGPAPHPNKELVSYTRLHGIASGRSATADLAVTLGSIARADTNGSLWLFSGTYELTVDTSPSVLTHRFELTGEPAQISQWPQEPAA